jgi:hypothetical protein
VHGNLPVNKLAEQEHQGGYVDDVEKDFHDYLTRVFLSRAQFSQPARA